ncbi:hypothetical protein C8034_v005250 [Colletotrichum sidae]|uniref:Uncharacterized protein n=1 Tax=Colletotrichum sidae TaxID=1347389 RepID=A0A4R8T756_9PEZI|nr:hypothetical protein C8034_v005250 [Colletotrichum sidae]
MSASFDATSSSQCSDELEGTSSAEEHGDSLAANGSHHGSDDERSQESVFPSDLHPAFQDLNISSPSSSSPESDQPSSSTERLADEIDENDRLSMDQSLLTSIFGANAIGFHNSTVLTWIQLEKGLDELNLREGLRLPDDTQLIIVILDTGFPDREMILERYDALDKYSESLVGTAAEGKVMVYPDREEAEADGQKVPDIRKMDQVATSRGDWRPVTCFGDGECVLQGIRSLCKRSWSGCSSHVGEQICKPRLTCTSPDRPEPPAPTTGEPWFHQEYVFFITRCEFRIFIVTVPSSRGLRGRQGKVITAISYPGRLRDQTQPSEEDYLRFGLTRAQVHDFALDVFECLRELDTPGLRSLEVGCRLDVSAFCSGGPLFVNEITRWYGAHYFQSECTPEPHTMISKAFANAFCGIHVSPELEQPVNTVYDPSTASPDATSVPRRRQRGLARKRDDFGAVIP